MAARQPIGRAATSTKVRPLYGSVGRGARLGGWPPGQSEEATLELGVARVLTRDVEEKVRMERGAGGAARPYEACST